MFASVDQESGEAASAYGIYWYAYPDWQRYSIDSNVNFRADDFLIHVTNL
ncbi:hypothetical protein GF407_07825 [candidate division KSB1 bacterium]|nr:hypothetical protein [candidate division KSB1 bacterium]